MTKRKRRNLEFWWGLDIRSTRRLSVSHPLLASAFLESSKLPPFLSSTCLFSSSRTLCTFDQIRKYRQSAKDSVIYNKAKLPFPARFTHLVEVSVRHDRLASFHTTVPSSNGCSSIRGNQS